MNTDVKMSSAQKMLVKKLEKAIEPLGLTLYLAIDEGGQVNLCVTDDSSDGAGDGNFPFFDDTEYLM